MSALPAPRGVLFVCLGNICRSPAAEAVFRHRVLKAGHGRSLQVDSCGLGDWHAGELPDPRMRRAGEARGYTLDHHARKLQPADFQRFAYLITLDDQIHKQVLWAAPSPAHGRKVLRFCDHLARHQNTEVPDPYYGSDRDFELVLDLLEDGCPRLLAHVLSPDPGGERLDDPPRDDP